MPVPEDVLEQAIFNVSDLAGEVLGNDAFTPDEMSVDRPSWGGAGAN